MGAWDATLKRDLEGLTVKSELIDMWRLKLTRVRSKLGHVRDFFSSYLRGVKLFGSEVRVATRLAWRVYGQGKRTSRQERLHMRRPQNFVGGALSIPPHLRRVAQRKM